MYRTEIYDLIIVGGGLGGLPAGRLLEVEAIPPGFEVNPKVMGVASWVLQNRQPAGRGTRTIPQARSSFFPIITGDKIMGVMAITTESERLLPQKIWW